MIQYMLNDTGIDEGMDGTLIFDDTGIEKRGKCSIGVTRQYLRYSEQSGNCQVIVC
ncbi:MAG TPA: transposase [Cytophagaceae bacterium]